MKAREKLDRAKKKKEGRGGGGGGGGRNGRRAFKTFVNGPVLVYQLRQSSTVFFFKLRLV